MKKIIYVAMVILLMSFTSAAVSRSGSASNVNYATGLTGSYVKAYWAVHDTLGSGCSNVAIGDCSPVGGGVGECSVAGNAIRIVGYTLESGGAVPSSVSVELTGTGSCSLSSGLYVESFNDGSANTGSMLSISGSQTLNFGGGMCPLQGDVDPCDGNVCNGELLSYMSTWKNTHNNPGCDSDESCVSNSKLLTAMSNWKNTHGAC